MSMPAWITAARRAQRAAPEPIMYRCANGPLVDCWLTLTTPPPAIDEPDSDLRSATLPIVVRGQSGVYGIIGDGTLRWFADGDAGRPLSSD